MPARIFHPGTLVAQGFALQTDLLTVDRHERADYTVACSASRHGPGVSQVIASCSRERASSITGHQEGRTSSGPVTSRNGVSRMPRRCKKRFNLTDSQVIEKLVEQLK